MTSPRDSREGAAPAARRRLVNTAAAALLLALCAVPAASLEQRAVAAGEAEAWLAALASAMGQVVVPPDADVCGASLAVADGGLIDRSCGLVPDAADAAQEQAGPGLALVEVAAFETPRFWTEMAPLQAGTGGAVVRVHGYGAVAAMGADGETLWQRTGLSFFPDWGLEPWIVPIVPIGRSPIDPSVWAGERAFAVGDLTGDGSGEIVVTHLVWEGGPDNQGRSAVTVLDAASGQTLWTRLYQGAVTQVLVHERTLFVGEETGPRTRKGFGPMGQEGSDTRMHAVAFADGPAGLQPEDRWTSPTGRPWARWLGFEPAGEGRVAAAWTDKPLGQSGVAGRVLVLDATAGTLLWEQTTDGYPRMLRHDPDRGELVVHEQTDSLTTAAPGLTDIDFAYSLTARDAADGAERLRVEREDALLLSLELADVTGDGMAEWVTGDAAFRALPVNGLLGVMPWWLADTFDAGRVIAADGDDGTERWRHTDAPGPDGLALPYGLQAVEGRSGPLVAAASLVVVSPDDALGQAFEPTGFTHLFNRLSGTDLRMLDGGDGGVQWQERGEHVAFPLSVTHTRSGEETALVTMTERLAVRTHDVESGELVAHTPLLADAFAAAVVDVTGDRTMDLLLGTKGGGVFAVERLTPGGEPQVLWRTTVGDSVRMLEVADVTGDGAQEVVVAATTAVHVLRSGDGAVLYTIDYPGEFVWTVTVDDLTGDGVDDIVVPTRTLAGYGGRDGGLLWRYEPTAGYFSTAVVSGGRAVAAFNPMNRTTHVAVAVEGATGQVAWEQPHAGPADITRLWRSVALLPGQGRQGGDAVAFLYDARTLPSGWGPAAMVYDLVSGGLMWKSGPAGISTVHEQALVRDGDLHQLTWYGWGRFTSDATDAIAWSGPAFTAAFADFGPAGEMLLTGALTVMAHSPEVIWGDPTGKLEPVATWRGHLHAEELLAVDLTGDGLDEVVAVKQDDEARSRVAAFEGTSRFGVSYYPYGVAILAGAERGAPQ